MPFLRLLGPLVLILVGSSSSSSRNNHHAVVEGFSLLAAPAATSGRLLLRPTPTATLFLSLNKNARKGSVSSSRLFAEDEEDESSSSLAASTESSTSTNSTATYTTSTTTSTELGGRLDTGALVKYIAAIVIQMSLVTALFQGLDRLVLVTNLTHKIPFAVNAIGMYFLALKSRVFNPLSNRRPDPKTKELSDTTQAQRRKMPTWTPPGVVFPIVWLLLIGPLRAVTSAMIIRAAGGIYTTQALLALMLHLSIGDVWNTINNVEQRYGTSVVGVLCVWASAAFAARQYYLAVPLAGKLLSLKLIWLTVATSLIVRTWQLNPKNTSTKEKANHQPSLAPLLPTRGDGAAETKFDWFSNKGG